MTQTRKILVVGTGAVGGFYGGYLAKSGTSVSVLSRSDFHIVREKGIKIKSLLGDYNFVPDQVVKNVSDYKGTPDYILVATKVLPELNISSLIKSAVKPGTSIILLQNGIDIEKDAVSSFPDNEIISALAFICVSRPSYGEIDHTDFGSLIIGRYPRGRSQKINELSDMFTASGIKCTIDENITGSRWKKLVWNAPFNPISVLGGKLDTREMTESDEVLTLSRAIMSEIIELARLEGHSLPEKIIENTIETTKKMVPFKTSMLQDFERRKPMESEAILGNALRLGKKHDLDMPYTESLYLMLTTVDRKNRSV